MSIPTGKEEEADRSTGWAGLQGSPRGLGQPINYSGRALQQCLRLRCGPRLRTLRRGPCPWRRHSSSATFQRRLRAECCKPAAPLQVRGLTAFHPEGKFGQCNTAPPPPVNPTPELIRILFPSQPWGNWQDFPMVPFTFLLSIFYIRSVSSIVELRSLGMNPQEGLRAQIAVLS